MTISLLRDVSTILRHGCFTIVSKISTSTAGNITAGGLLIRTVKSTNNIFGIKARKNREGGYISETYKAITKEENKDGDEEYLYQDFEVYKNIEAK